MGEALITRRGGGGDVTGMTLKKVMDVTNFTRTSNNKITITQDNWRDIIVIDKLYKLIMDVSHTAIGEADDGKYRTEIYLVGDTYLGDTLMLSTAVGSQCISFFIDHETGQSQRVSYNIETSVTNSAIGLEKSNVGKITFPSDLSLYKITLYEVEY